MEKPLNKTQLKAKMYDVLLCMHTNNPKVIFNVFDERHEHPKSNRIVIRASFFTWNEEKKFDEEFAAVDYLNATDEDLIAKAYVLGEEAENGRVRLIEGK